MLSRAAFNPVVQEPGQSLQRHRQLQSLVDPWSAAEIKWVTDHRLVNAQKVFINVYHLLRPFCNSMLGACGLGGAYHTAVEVFGTEYAFGGHYDEEQGIYNIKPLHVLREEALKGLQGEPQERAGHQEQLLVLPALSRRLVVGWWTGSAAEFEELLLYMKTQRCWRAPSYRLLSRNCNHFVADLCQHLLASPAFQSAPGMDSIQKMVPRRILALTDFTLAHCCARCTEVLDEQMLPAPYAADVFEGEARYCASPEGSRAEMQGDVTSATSAASSSPQTPLPLPPPALLPPRPPPSEAALAAGLAAMQREQRRAVMPPTRGGRGVVPGRSRAKPGGGPWKWEVPVDGQGSEEQIPAMRVSAGGTSGGGSGADEEVVASGVELCDVMMAPLPLAMRGDRLRYNCEGREQASDGPQ